MPRRKRGGSLDPPRISTAERAKINALRRLRFRERRAAEAGNTEELHRLKNLAREVTRRAAEDQEAAVLLCRQRKAAHDAARRAAEEEEEAAILRYEEAQSAPRDNDAGCRANRQSQPGVFLGSILYLRPSAFGAGPMTERMVMPADSAAAMSLSMAYEVDALSDAQRKHYAAVEQTFDDLIAKLKEQSAANVVAASAKPADVPTRRTKKPAVVKKVVSTCASTVNTSVSSTPAAATPPASSVVSSPAATTSLLRDLGSRNNRSSTLRDGATSLVYSSPVPCVSAGVADNGVGARTATVALPTCVSPVVSIPPSAAAAKSSSTVATAAASSAPTAAPVSESRSVATSTGSVTVVLVRGSPPVDVDLEQPVIPPPFRPPARYSPQQLQGTPGLLVCLRTPYMLLQLASGRTPPSTRSELDDRVKRLLMLTAPQLTEWMLRAGLIRSAQYCVSHPVDGMGRPRPLKLGMFTDSGRLAHCGGYVWVKSCCRRKYVSVYYGSLFDNVRPNEPLTRPVTLIKLMYHWCCQTLLHNVVSWLSVRHTLVDEVYALFRAVCMLTMEEPQSKLGGSGCTVQVGLVSLGTAEPDGSNKVVKVEVLGVKEVMSGEVRLMGFNPQIKNRIMSVVAAVRDWVHPLAALLLDSGIRPDPFRPYFKGVDVSPATSFKDQPDAIWFFLRRNLPRMFSSALPHMTAYTVCQFIAEMNWREKFGRDQNKCFSKLLEHLSDVTQTCNGSLIEMLNRVMVSPAMDLKRKPRKQALAARPDSQPEFPAVEGSAAPAASVQTAGAAVTKPPPSVPAAAAAVRDLPADQAAVLHDDVYHSSSSTGTSRSDTTGSELSRKRRRKGGSSSGGSKSKRAAMRRRSTPLDQRGGANEPLPLSAQPESSHGPVYKLRQFSDGVMPQLPSTDLCYECKLPLTLPNHISGVYVCKRCRYSTCCQNIYPVHQRVFHSRGVMPVYSMSQPVLLKHQLVCSCGYRSNSGNKLASHLVSCGKKTAYPTTETPDGMKLENTTGSSLRYAPMVMIPSSAPSYFRDVLKK